MFDKAKAVRNPSGDSPGRRAHAARRREVIVEVWVRIKKTPGRMGRPGA